MRTGGVDLPRLDDQLSQEWYNMGRIIYSAGRHSGRVANHMKTGVLVKYKDFLPITSKTPLFSLGRDFSQKRVVCMVTGTGLKDSDTALKSAKPFLELPADLVAVEKALGWS